MEQIYRTVQILRVNLALRRLLGCLFAFVLFLQIGIAQTTQGESAYLMAPGDRISISVYGEPDLSFSDLPIPSNGLIAFPFLGQLRADNKSEIELSNDITRGLQDGYLLQPQVTVAVTRYRPIFVGGAVQGPGQKEFSIGMDVERLIALAGGFTKQADINQVVIQRKNESTRVELAANLFSEVLPGDVVTIGESEIIEKEVEYFYLHGEINKPGRYEYSDDLSVQKAIAIAGGFGARASKKKISITRGVEQQKLNKMSLDSEIHPGDVITVGASLF